MKFKNITLKEMFDICIDCILNNKEKPTFYYETEYEIGKFNYQEIMEIDLLDSRFKTIDDFSEYEWEIAKSNIYIKEE